MTVLNGPDGKFMVDTFVEPAWPKLKEALDGLGNAPVRYVIDTHWHFDHTDNNAHLHAAGTTVVAHKNTWKRMSEPHDQPVLYRGPDGALHDLHFDASPAEALPQMTFPDSYKLQANGETLALQYFAPAHTDSDIYAHFQKANVIQMGDAFFNGMYPLHRPRYGRQNHRHDALPIDALESFLIAGWQMMRPVSHMDWLIWSNDHGGWSKPNRHGYTNRLADAGRYSFDEALEIVQDANSGTLARNFPSETMCPDWTEETPGAPSGS